MAKASHCNQVSALTGDPVSSRGEAFAVGCSSGHAGYGSNYPHLQRLALAITASLAFYALLPWLDLLPKPVADTVILGLWSVPGLFFLSAFYPSPLFVQVPERLAALRVALLTIVSFACSLALLFLVTRLLGFLNSLAGVPLRAM